MPKSVRERNKREKARKKNFLKNSRQRPDTAYQTYLGKPAFANYGNANVNPSNGGTVYGQYMKTHNINPHRADNNPKHPQVYERAEEEYGKLDLKQFSP